MGIRGAVALPLVRLERPSLRLQSLDLSVNIVVASDIIIL
jgi:hypothetical protein